MTSLFWSAARASAPPPRKAVNPFSIHRLLAISLVVSVKFHEDVVYSNLARAWQQAHLGFTQLALLSVSFCCIGQMRQIVGKDFGVCDTSVQLLPCPKKTNLGRARLEILRLRNPRQAPQTNESK